MATALGGRVPARTLELTAKELCVERDRLSTAQGDRLDVIAVGSPHFSLDEFNSLIRLFSGRTTRLPFYVCTGRHVLEELQALDRLRDLEEIGVQLILDTCVVVTAY